MAKNPVTQIIISAKDESQAALSSVAKNAKNAANEIAALAQDAAALEATSGDLTPEVQSLGAALSQLANQQQLIGEFVSARVATDAAKSAFEEAQLKAQALGKELANTAQPSRAMTAEFAAARKEVKATESEWQKQAVALQSVRKGMSEAGVSSTSLAAAQTKINAEVKEGRERLEDYANKVAKATAAEEKRTAEVRESAAEQERVAKAVAASLDNAFNKVGVRSASAIQAEIARINQALQRLGSDARVSGDEFDRAWQSGQTQLKKLQTELDGTGTAARGAGDAIDDMGAKTGGMGNMAQTAAGYLKGMVAALGVREVLEIATGMESLRAGLAAVAGDAEKAATEMDFVKSVASQAGIDVQVAARAYLSLAAATKGTAVEGDATREVFQAVSAAMATAGKSSVETQSALTALAQMAGKGVVSMEELRGQLGEALPGALNAAAKGLGITTQELIALTESGKLTAQQLFPALVSGLNELYGAGKQTGQTLGQEFANIKNAFVDLVDSIQTSGGFEPLKIGAEIAQAAIALLDVALVGIGKTIGVLAGALVTLDFSGLPAAFAEIEREAQDKLTKAAQHNDTLRNAMGLAKQEAAAMAGQVATTAVSTDALGKSAAAAVPAVQSLAAATADAEVKAAEAALQLGAALPEALAKIDTTQLQHLADTTLVKLREEVEFATQAVDGLAVVQAHANAQLAEADAAWVALATSGSATQAQLQAATEAMLGAGAQVRAVAEEMATAQDTAREKTDAFNAAVKALGDRAAQILGVDLVQYSAGVSAEFARSSQALDLLIANFAPLQSAGVNAGGAITAALGNMADKAGNTAELDALREKLIQLGKDGKLSADQVATALAQIENRFADLAPGINTIAEAFRELRITSDAELKAIAGNARQAFDQIRDSGTATPRELQAAFAAYAEKAIAANDGVATGALKAEASIHKVRIEADETGKAIVSAMGDGVQALDALGNKAEETAAKVGLIKRQADGLKGVWDENGNLIDKDSAPRTSGGVLVRAGWEDWPQNELLRAAGGSMGKHLVEGANAELARRNGGGSSLQGGRVGGYDAPQPREQITTYRVQIGTGAGRSQTINTASKADAEALTALLRQLEADMSRA